MHPSQQAEDYLSWILATFCRFERDLRAVIAFVGTSSSSAMKLIMLWLAWEKDRTGQEDGVRRAGKGVSKVRKGGGLRAYLE